MTAPGVVPLVPVPDTATCCGLLLALSVKVSVAVRVPEVVGLKMMLAVQLAEAARVDPQVVLKTEKSPGLAPEKLALLTGLTVIVPLLLLVSVTTFCPPALPTATLPQTSEVGEAEAEPPAAAAVPESATVRGDEPAVMFQLAVTVPEVVGLKSTEAVQLEDAAREDPQVVVAPKSLAPVPVIPGVPRATELAVLFVTVMP